MTTIRLKGNDGQWIPFACEASEQTGQSAKLSVPELNGTWLIQRTGMLANTGGNDWRIYTLNPEDCERLCLIPNRPKEIGRGVMEYPDGIGMGIWEERVK